LDTKSIKSRPFAAWLCFFMGVSIFIFLLFTGLSVLNHSQWDMDALKTPFRNDYKSSNAFKERTGHYFNNLFSLVADPSSHDNSYQEMTIQRLNNEGINLKYYAVNLDTGLLINNLEGDLSFSSSEGMPVLPADYKYYWYFDGNKLWVMDNGQAVDIRRLDSGYQNISPRLNNISAKYNSNSRVVLAVKDTLEKNPYSQSLYYGEQQFLAILGWVYITLGMLSIALLIYALIRRRDKRDFDRRLASWSGSVWLEIKIVLSLPLLMVGLRVGSTSWSDLSRMVLATTFTSIEILLFFWWFYVLLVDLIVNRRTFFSHNFINSLIKWYQKYESQYSWQQSMLKRAYMLVAAETVLASVFSLIIAISLSDFVPLFIALLIAGAGVYIVYRYLHRYKQTISDLGKLIDHIELIKSGDMESRLELAAEADMYPAAQNLNALQEGMSINVAEKMKSEHLKIELVTNVSHDLKTPLTSIISYVDLLAKEEDLPTHVNDYVKILVQKSERLKNLIQDLFDLSKASSGNIALDMEQLDFARLIKQTLADMEEPISKSGLTFRINIPDEPVYILADGQKLYRVWENLITNALKYSLPGSRVFVDLTVEDEGVLATIKNTANEEMNFGEDEILQRFVRGDSARTTEGAGLGLSIAQQFTQICGGNFSIKIDGDLFKVELLFTQNTCLLQI